MRLVSVTVRNYRIHRELSVGFGPGVTVIAGPNESGKSTLVEAIHHALFLRARATGEVAQSLRSSLHAGHPAVALEFEAEGKRWTIEKTFTGTQAGATILREHGGRTRHNEEAEEEIHRLVQEDEAGGGRGLAERVRTRWAHLWTWQGKAGAPPAEQGAGSRSMGRLRDRLGRLGGGGVLESALDAAVARRLEERHAVNHTDTGRVRAGSDLARAAEEATAAAEARRGADAALERLEAAVRRLEGAERLLAEGARSADRLRGELAAVGARREALSRIDLELASARGEAEAARRVHEEWARADAEIRGLDGRIAAAEQGLAPARGELECAKSAAADHRRRFDTAAASLGELAGLQREAGTLVEWLTLVERYEHRRAERVGLASRCDRILAHRTAAERIRERVRELPPVNAADVEALVALERAVERALVELDSIATRVEIVAADVPVRMDGRELPVGSAETITAPRELEAGGARVRIVPGGGRSLGACTERRDAAVAALAARLESLGVADVERARTVAATRAALEGEWLSESRTIEGLGADAALRDLAALDVEVADLDSRVGHLAPVGAVRPDGLEAARHERRAAEDRAHDVAGRSARASAEFEALKRLVAGAAAEQERAADAIREAEGALADLRSRRAVLVEKAGEEREGELSARAEARTAAEERLTGLEARRAALDPAGIERDEMRLRQSLDGALEATHRAETDRQLALAVFQSAGTADPHEDRARAAAREARAVAELAALERRSAAEGLLATLFAEKKRAVEDRFVEPLRARVSGYLQRLFGADAEVTLDLDGDSVGGLALVRRGQGGAAFDFEALSGGTREQVGAALRLAMAEILAHDHDGCLPVVFDDAFVNADPERIRGLERMLDLGVQRGLQILVLTCDATDYDGLGVGILRIDPAAGAS